MRDMLDVATPAFVRIHTQLSLVHFVDSKAEPVRRKLAEKAVLPRSPPMITAPAEPVAGVMERFPMQYA